MGGPPSPPSFSGWLLPRGGHGGPPIQACKSTLTAKSRERDRKKQQPLETEIAARGFIPFGQAVTVARDPARANGDSRNAERDRYVRISRRAIKPRFDSQHSRTFDRRAHEP